MGRKVKQKIIITDRRRKVKATRRSLEIISKNWTRKTRIRTTFVINW